MGPLSGLNLTCDNYKQKMFLERICLQIRTGEIPTSNPFHAEGGNTVHHRENNVSALIVHSCNWFSVL